MLIVLFGTFALRTLTAWVRVINAEHQLQKDYVSLVVADQLAGEEPTQLYDLDVQRQVQARLDPDGAPRPFANPPHVVTFGRLLTALGPETGYLILSLLNLAGLATLSVLVWRLGQSVPQLTRLAITIGTLATFSVATALEEGAITVISGLGLALIVWGDHRRSNWVIASGLVLAAAKPHLVVVPFGILLARYAWPALQRALLLGAAVIAASLLTPGAGAWGRWPRAIVDLGAAGSEAAVRSFRWWNLAGVVPEFLAIPPDIWQRLSLLLAFCGIACAVLIGRRSPTPITLALATIAGLLLSPHTNPHDALWIPLAYMLVRSHASWTMRTGGNRALLTALAVAWPPLTVIACLNATSGGSVLAVAAMAGFIGLAVKHGTKLSTPAEL